MNCLDELLRAGTLAQHFGQRLGLAVFAAVLQQDHHRVLGVDVLRVQLQRPAEAGLGVLALVPPILRQPQGGPRGGRLAVGVDGPLGGLFGRARPSPRGHEPGVVGQQFGPLVGKLDRPFECLLRQREPIEPPGGQPQEPMGVVALRIEFDSPTRFAERLAAVAGAQHGLRPHRPGQRVVGHGGGQLVGQGQRLHVVAAGQGVEHAVDLSVQFVAVHGEIVTLSALRNGKPHCGHYIRKSPRLAMQLPFGLEMARGVGYDPGD